MRVLVIGDADAKMQAGAWCAAKGHTLENYDLDDPTGFESQFVRDGQVAMNHADIVLFVGPVNTARAQARFYELARYTYRDDLDAWVEHSAYVWTGEPPQWMNYVGTNHRDILTALDELAEAYNEENDDADMFGDLDDELDDEGVEEED